MGSRAVVDSGPILHLTEINFITALDIFSEVLAPIEIAGELRKSRISIPKRIKIVSLINERKDMAKVLSNQENLDLGESCAIVLCIQEKADYFLTDDLDARNAAKKYNLEVHGTAGIILRSYRKKIINKTAAIEKIRKLKIISSLYITQDLIEKIVNAIEEFSKRNYNGKHNYLNKLPYVSRI